MFLSELKGKGVSTQVCGGFFFSPQNVRVSLPSFLSLSMMDFLISTLFKSEYLPC